MKVLGKNWFLPIFGVFVIIWGMLMLIPVNFEGPVTFRGLVALFDMIAGVFCITVWLAFRTGINSMKW